MPTTKKPTINEVQTADIGELQAFMERLSERLKAVEDKQAQIDKKLDEINKWIIKYGNL
jgi:chaperonin cofactor prefoldin